jgi:hypothetical protein
VDPIEEADPMRLPKAGCCEAGSGSEGSGEISRRSNVRCRTDPIGQPSREAEAKDPAFRARVMCGSAPGKFTISLGETYQDTASPLSP